MALGFSKATPSTPGFELGVCWCWVAGHGSWWTSTLTQGGRGGGDRGQNVDTDHLYMMMFM